MPKLIQFQRTDILRADIEEIVKEFSEHFKIPRNYFVEFTRIIHLSRNWSYGNLYNELNNWATLFGKFPDSQECIHLCRRAFDLCGNKDDINKLRGSLLESLLIASHGGSCTLINPAYGWGAKVKIRTPTEVKTVRYTCQERTNNLCIDKSTVDFGHWDGNIAKLYECKAKPYGVGCVDIRYFHHLQKQLIDNNITHELYFVSLEEKEEIEMIVKQSMLKIGIPLIFQGMGVNELKILISA